jgi:3-hydroxy-9,10-secoandrosta-1,3,5(10)-triene-9,17-dione monooxygenase reductase component
VSGSGGSTVHFGDPWADPEQSRDPVRRIRGRLPAGVTVWTSGRSAADPSGWAGLTVSSLLLAQGEPAGLAGLVGPDTDLAEMIDATNRFVVHPLSDTPSHRRLAQHFAGILPAADELLRTEPSPYGPLLTSVADRLYCRVKESRPLGWSVLVTAAIDDVTLATAGPGLAWHRGRFHRITTGQQ